MSITQRRRGEIYFCSCVCGCNEAVIYLRVEYKNERVSIAISFVTLKTKVALDLLQSTSIPCLELMGANLGKRIVLTVVDMLNIRKEFITFRTDSTSILWWVN